LHLTYPMATYEDLFPVIDRSQSEVLGSKSKAVSSILKEADNEDYAESDLDEQLIITVRFQSVVKVHSFSINAQNDDTAPKTLKIYANEDNTGFEDLAELAPVQEFTLSADQINNRIALKFVKFQNVNSFTVFVVDNAGNEHTRINKLTLYGQPKETTKMSEFKKVEGPHFTTYDAPRGVEVNREKQ